jgi:ADP-ribose diphosphatase
MSRASKHQPWKVIKSALVYRADPWFAVERQKVELPDGRVIADYHRITLPDCAGVVVQLEDGRFLATRQYRHGPGRVSLTLPGGTLNPGESPLEGAKRELLEETGYEAPEWKPLGSFTMNANYGCGTVHFFLAHSARRSAAPISDDLEESEIVLLSRDALRRAVGNGEVAALAAVAAILLALSP